MSYDPTTQIGMVRLLIADTSDPPNQIFTDTEVQVALNINSSAFLYVSGQAAPTALGVQVPYAVTSIWRAAATLLRSLAGSRARLSRVVQLLDVKLSDKDIALSLRELASEWEEREDNSGSHAIAEIVVNEFSARERLVNQLMRLSG